MDDVSRTVSGVVRTSPAHGDAARPPGPEPASNAGDKTTVTDVGKLVRLASMTRMLLYEANTIELDEAARHRLADVHNRCVAAMSELLDRDLRDEFEHLQLLFSEDVLPTTAELRIAQAQLVGWLEGLFQGIRVTLLTQQLASQEQLAGIYSEALERRPKDDREPGTPYL
jgi:hypothetical protein